MKARLAVKVRAGARRTEFAGRLGDAWKLHVAAPPVDGKANDAIVRFFAKLCNVPVKSVRIAAGLAAASKLIEIEGVDAGTLERAILESHGSDPHSGSSAPRKS